MSQRLQLYSRRHYILGSILGNIAFFIQLANVSQSNLNLILVTWVSPQGQETALINSFQTSESWAKTQ